MRMMLDVRLPNEPFNTYAREGVAKDKLERVLQAIQPEAVYFTEREGARGAIVIVDVPDPARIPALCEPFFIEFAAEVRPRIAMTQEDLGNAKLDQIGKHWGR